MPSYDFLCADCGRRRGVTGGHDETRAMVLVCDGCGGDMRVAPVLTLHVLARTPEAPAPAPKACGHHHACRCGSVRLTRPNPFGAEIARASAEPDGT